MAHIGHFFRETAENCNFLIYGLIELKFGRGVHGRDRSILCLVNFFSGTHRFFGKWQKLIFSITNGQNGLKFGRGGQGEVGMGWPGRLAGRVGREGWPGGSAGRVGREGWLGGLAWRVGREGWPGV